MPTPKGGADGKSVTQDKDGAVANDKTPPVNPRNALIEGFAAKVSARHVADQTKAIEEGSVVLDDEPGAEPETVPSGAAKDDTGAVAPAGDKEVPGAGADPLAGFVFIQDGKAVVKLKVDGREQTISADEARTILQKNVSADARLQQAAQLRKDLDARAATIQAREADIATREQKLKSQLPQADAGDPDLDADADGLANTLLTGTEAEVAAKLKTVLKKTRQAPAPVDKKAIVTEVVQTVTAAQQQTSLKEAIRKDLDKFDTDFPEIKADKKLSAVADAISDEVKTEHPDWSFAQILAESGNRTREFVKPTKADAPGAVNRQARKDSLRPMPSARAATPGKKEDVKPMTPADIVAEQRRARGQAA